APDVAAQAPRACAGLRDRLIAARPHRRQRATVESTRSAGGMSDMSAESAEALEVLREVWRSTGQTAAGLDDCGEKACKRMTDAGVGFDDFAGDTDLDRIEAWRARLEREGKLGRSGSVADLVLGPREAATRPEGR